jgi:beta-glucosidase
VVESSVYDIMIGSSSADIRQSTTWNVRGETIPARDLSKVTRAENFDAYAPAVKLVDESKASGTAVGSSAAGDWIAFKDADLRGSSFRASVSALAATTIQVRLDSPAGKLLGTAAVPATGDLYQYATTTAALAPVRPGGHHDVYLVFGDALRVSTFSIR